VLDEKGSPKVLSESSKRVLYKDIEPALQRACQGLMGQLDDFFLHASDRAHREAGDGAVALSTKLIKRRISPLERECD
jgi:hypothetical protein